MSDTQRFLTAMQIIGHAAERHGIMSGEAHTFPLPVKNGNDVHGVVLFYQEGMKPNEELVYPPHYMVAVDAVTGDIVEFRNCEPSDFGVAQERGIPTEGFGLDPDLTPDEFWNSIDRFMEISSLVWEIYATGVTALDPRNVDLVSEYRSTLDRITKAPLRPYYEAVAAEFYEWLGRVLS